MLPSSAPLHEALGLGGAQQLAMSRLPEQVVQVMGAVDGATHTSPKRDAEVATLRLQL